MAKPYQLALTEDEFAEKYADLCNYIEAMWAKRRCKDYYHVDDADILHVVSPQSRAVALKICMDILGIEYEPWERADRVLARGRRKAAKKKARK